MTTMETGTALWPITLNPSDHPTAASDRDAVLADPGFGRSFTGVKELKETVKVPSPMGVSPSGVVGIGPAVTAGSGA